MRSNRISLKARGYVKNLGDVRQVNAVREHIKYLQLCVH